MLNHRAIIVISFNLDDFGAETTMLIVGAKQAGKTSLVLKLLGKGNSRLSKMIIQVHLSLLNIHSAVAQRGLPEPRMLCISGSLVNYSKSAGGTSLTELANVPLTEANIHTSSIVIAVDLSKVLYNFKFSLAISFLS